MIDAELWANQSASPVMLAFVAFLGALWGSFANVCIYRMPPTDENPKGLSVVQPGSHCSHCKHPVRWYDNVPMLSYLWLKGKCRDCGTSFSPRYLLVEAAVAMLFVAVYYYVVAIAYTDTAPTEQLIRSGVLAAFCWLMVVIAFIDLDHRLILNKITYPAIPIMYGLGLLLPGATWKTGLIGIVVGYGLVRAIADLFWLVTRREGMGYGDGKLLAIVGALFGWQGVLVGLFLGSLVGTTLLIPILIAGRIRAACQPNDKTDEDNSTEPDSVEDCNESEEEDIPNWRRVELPFGPFIAIAAVLFIFIEARLRLHFFFLW
ncbi:MAG: prepilin peptidase [Kofleriaceae bacterium]|nr:prepilin peptidase [Kofleriaceae bacterium]